MGREGEKVMGARREGGRWGQREEEEGGEPSRIDSAGNKQPKPGGGSWIGKGGEAGEKTAT